MAGCGITGVTLVSPLHDIVVHSALNVYNFVVREDVNHGNSKEGATSSNCVDLHSGGPKGAQGGSELP